MKNISFTEFEQIFAYLKNYDDEINSLNEALKPFLDGGHLEIGYFLMDGYIDLAAKYLDVDAEYICWFVFENDWGIKKKILTKKKVKTLKDFYNELIKL